MDSRYLRRVLQVFLILPFAVSPGKVFGQTSVPTDDEKHYTEKGLTPISGSIHGRIEGSVVVDGEMVIGKNHSATIEPGTVLMMTRDAGITVKGKLYANGDWKNQISILPLRWEDYRDPPPLDLPLSWDCIRVEPEGELVCKFTRIDKSRMGIVIDPAAKRVRLDTVWFTNSEHSSLKIGANEVRAGKDGLFESYVYTSEVSSPGTKPLSLLTRAIPPLRRREPKSTIVPLISSVLCLGAGTMISLHYEGLYNDLARERTDKGKWTEVTPESKKRVDQIERELRELRPVVTLGDVLIATGAVGIVVTFPLEGLLSGGNR